MLWSAWTIPLQAEEHALCLGSYSRRWPAETQEYAGDVALSWSAAPVVF